MTSSTDDARSTDNQKPRNKTPTRPNRRPAPRSGALINTAGPEPDALLADVWLTVGTAVGTHGVQGEVKVRLETDDLEHFQTLKQITFGNDLQPRRILACRFHKGFALLTLQGVSTPEEAFALRGQSLKIAGTDARPLNPGEFYLYQLIGLAAETEAGEPLGLVVDLIETGASNVFVIRPSEGADVLLPDRPDVILGIYPDERRIVVRPLVYAE